MVGWNQNKDVCIFGNALLFGSRVCRQVLQINQKCQLSQPCLLFAHKHLRAKAGGSKKAERLCDAHTTVENEYEWCVHYFASSHGIHYECVQTSNQEPREDVDKNSPNIANICTKLAKLSWCSRIRTVKHVQSGRNFVVFPNLVHAVKLCLIIHWNVTMKSSVSRVCSD